MHLFLGHVVIFDYLFIQKTHHQLLRRSDSIEAVYIAMMQKLQVLTSYFLGNKPFIHCSDNHHNYLDRLNTWVTFTVTKYEI